jgi:hypothetical protein
MCIQTQQSETAAKTRLFRKYYIQPLKMDLTESSETSAKHNLTPGKYPKEHIQDSEHGENLKPRTNLHSFTFHQPQME